MCAAPEPSNLERQLEGPLRRARDPLAVILGSIAEGILVQDATGQIVFANEIGARMCGFDSVDGFLRSPISEVLRRFELHDESLRPLPVELLPARRVFRGEQPPPMLIRSRACPSGEWRWGLVKATPIHNLETGQIEFVVSAFRDITEERRSADTQRFLAEAGQVLSSSLDYEATLAAVVQLAVPRLADWCAIEILQEGETLPRQLAVVHSDPAKAELARELRRRYPPDPAAPVGLMRVLRTGKPDLIPEISEALVRAHAQDPEHARLLLELGLRSSMILPLLVQGRVLGALLFVSAESGRCYDQDDLALAVEIARRAALAVENARLYSEAQEAVRLRDVFFSVASHELKTPLTTLLLQSQGLLREVHRNLAAPSSALLNERIVKRAENIERQILRLDALVNELLDVSRITAGQLELNPSDFDLAELAREVIARFEDEAVRAGSPIALVAPRGVPGSWDRLRLDEVLTNLVSNALKYGAGQPIEMKIEIDASAVRVSVRDRGIGIPPGHQARIFEKFVRLVPERSYKGFGLGLWITRQIVEAHGGAIRVTSQPGDGSTFMVELPWRAAMQETRQQAAPAG
jgi:PAS domain S-box-containing protein